MAKNLKLGNRKGGKSKLPGMRVIQGGKGKATPKENRRPLRDAAIEPGAFDPPRYLNPQGVGIWEAAVRTLTLIDELSLDHIYGLHQLAYAWQRMVKRMHADQDIDHKDNESFRKMLVEYGLTPAARQRMDPKGLARFDKRKKRHTDEIPGGQAEQQGSEGPANPFAELRGDDTPKEESA